MMTPNFRRAVAFPMLILVTGCSTMQPVAQPREFLQTRQPSVVWLSKDNDQAMVAVDAPKLLGDSIVGFVEGEFTEIPMSQVRAMQAKQYSRSRTTQFVLASTAAAIALFFVLKSGAGANMEGVEEDDIGIIRR